LVFIVHVHDVIFYVLHSTVKMIFNCVSINLHKKTNLRFIFCYLFITVPKI